MNAMPRHLGYLHSSEPPDEPEESWMLSYLDVFALIATLFIVLTVLAQMRTEQLVEQRDAESAQRIASQASTDVTDTANTTANALEPSRVSGTLAPGTQRLDALPTALHALLNEPDLQQQIEVLTHADYTEVQIRDRILFASAEATLLPEGQMLLARLAPVLKESGAMIFVEGHTDNQPISTDRFQSNWELAAARATTVVHQFAALGIPAKRLRAVSVADSDPIASNQEESGRAQNRRVSLLLRQTAPTDARIAWQPHGVVFHPD
ncbi:MAG TPA: flagellar motor protein MotB [Permianibacter sp.]|nr:flagellar motor protein MotB [Permianibacter sp.]